MKISVYCYVGELSRITQYGNDQVQIFGADQFMQRLYNTLEACGFHPRYANIVDTRNPENLIVTRYIGVTARIREWNYAEKFIIFGSMESSDIEGPQERKMLRILLDREDEPMFTDDAARKPLLRL